MKHYEKPSQEKLPAEIIIHVGTNDLAKDIANVIMQLAKPVKTDASKVAVSSILPRKDKFNSKAEEVSRNVQDIYSTNNLPLITHININVKSLHLNSNGDAANQKFH